MRSNGCVFFVVKNSKIKTTKSIDYTNVITYFVPVWIFLSPWDTLGRKPSYNPMALREPHDDPKSQNDPEYNIYANYSTYHQYNNCRSNYIHTWSYIHVVVLPDSNGKWQINKKNERRKEEQYAIPDGFLHRGHNGNNCGAAKNTMTKQRG